MTSYLTDFLPGAVGAVLNTYTGHPFDTIRVRMQNYDSKYTSSFDCLKKTYRYCGLYGIFKGSSASLLSNLAENSVVFGVNEFIKREIYYSDSKSSVSLSHDMFVGSVSGLAATIASCPLETIKCNIQVSDEKNKKMMDVVKELRFSGMYTGFTASCLRNIPYYLFFFPLYTRYIELVSRCTKRDKADLGILDYSFAGGASGATTWAIVYPLDVIKCNQQIHREKIDMIGMAKFLYNSRGIRALYSGFGPTIVRAFPANAALLFGIEGTNRLLGNTTGQM